jgi:hypothetical protein
MNVQTVPTIDVVVKTGHLPGKNEGREVKELLRFTISH